MESTDLKSPEDDALAAFLKQPLPPLNDAGFSVHTVQRLPLLPAERLRRLRWLFVGAGLLAGLTVAFAGIDWMELGDLVFNSLAPSIPTSAELLTDPRLALGSLVCVGSLVYALLSNRSLFSGNG